MGRTVKGMRDYTSHERRIIRLNLIREYGTFCQICLAAKKSAKLAAIDMNTEREDRSFSIDHIVALADGGENTPDNMWPTHIVCNERKGSIKGGGRVRSNRKPRPRKTVTQNIGPRLAYSSSSY